MLAEITFAKPFGSVLIRDFQKLTGLCFMEAGVRATIKSAASPLPAHQAVPLHEGKRLLDGDPADLEFLAELRFGWNSITGRIVPFQPRLQDRPDHEIFGDRDHLHQQI